MIENINLHCIFFVDKSMKKRKSKKDCACFLLYPLTFLFKFRVSDVTTGNSTLQLLEYRLTFVTRLIGATNTKTTSQFLPQYSKRIIYRLLNNCIGRTEL